MDYLSAIIMKFFIVNFKDLANPKKNPGFKLGAKEILENKNIEKKYPDRSFMCSCCRGKYPYSLLGDEENGLCKFCVKK